MQYIIVAAVMFWLGWRLGRKYQDFQDLMIARRVAKLVDQRDLVEKEREQYERWERQDRRHKRKLEMEDDIDDRSVSRSTRARQDLLDDENGIEAHEERHPGLR